MKLFFIVVSVAWIAWSQEPSGFSIMTYNVENLFDDQHDNNKADETFLPLSQKSSQAHRSRCKVLENYKFRKDCLYLDWNKKVIDQKMKNIAKVILSTDDGHGPDILILAEVENISILEQLNKNYLKSAHYQTIDLIDGEDPRGIDVAILSRFKATEKAQLLSLNLKNAATGASLRTRGVLRVPLKLSNGSVLSVFAVHLPSQGNPTNVRSQGVQALNQILEKEKHNWIVGGDFNIIQKEEDQYHLISRELAQQGLVSHIIGCKTCKGTHFYKNKWSFLDILYFDSRLEKSGLYVLKESIQVVNSLFSNGRDKKPQRFDPAKGQGASDHFPMYARLRWQKQTD